MATVEYHSATRTFEGSDRPAVDHLDLSIADGEFVVLVGPSGCGKSTSLRMLAGLEPVNEGRVLIDRHDMRGVRARDRDVAMVFQSYALYPHMSVAENMAFALRNAKVGATEISSRVREAARILQLEDLLDRKPGKLSGGQRQRVAMGRAIVREPKVFCMDEPLSNLDAKLRVSTRSQIAGLQRRLGVTTVYVTHDQVEAMTMGDRVVVMLDGALQQVGTPAQLYENPVNTFVASFIGSPAITLAQAPIVDGRANWHGLHIPVPMCARDCPTVTVGMRPESWNVVSANEPQALRLRIDLIEALGAESYIYGTPVGGDAVQGEGHRVAVRLDKKTKPSLGDVLGVVPQPDEAYVFDPASGTALGRA